MLPLRDQIIIFATKWNDRDFRLFSRKAADAIAVQPGAVNQIFRADRSARGLDNRFSVAPGNAFDFRSDAHASTLRTDQLRVLRAHRDVVGDSRGRHVQPGQAAAMRFDLARLYLVQHFQTEDSVGLPAFQQSLQPGNFFGTGRNNDLAADLDRNSVLATEGLHRGRALHAQFGLQRTGLVIDSGMNDAAVVSTLMAGHPVFFLDQQKAKLGEGAAKLQGGRKSYNSASDNHNVKALIRHGLARPDQNVEGAAYKINGKAAQ